MYTWSVCDCNLCLNVLTPFLTQPRQPSIFARSLHHHGIPHHVVAIAIAALAVAIALPSPHIAMCLTADRILGSSFSMSISGWAKYVKPNLKFLTT